MNTTTTLRTDANATDLALAKKLHALVQAHFARGGTMEELQKIVGPNVLRLVTKG